MVITHAPPTYIFAGIFDKYQALLEIGGGGLGYKYVLLSNLAISSGRISSN